MHMIIRIKEVNLRKNCRLKLFCGNRPPREGVEVKRNMRETRGILVFRFSVGNRNIIYLYVAGFIGNET